LQIRVVKAFQAGLDRGRDHTRIGPSAARLMEISRQLRQQEREGWRKKTASEPDRIDRQTGKTRYGSLSSSR